MNTKYMTVLAWVTMDGSEFTGRHLGLYGERAELRTVARAHAVVWERTNTPVKSMTAAKAHALTLDDAEMVRVYKFLGTENDPLGRSRQQVLAEWEAQR